MKLYRRRDDGRIVGTQKDAGAAANREDFEVPTDKAGLIEFLNNHLPTEASEEVPAGSYTLDDFSTWLHIQPEHEDKCRAVQFIYKFNKEKREDTYYD